MLLDNTVLVRRFEYENFRAQTIVGALREAVGLQDMEGHRLAEFGGRNGSSCNTNGSNVALPQLAIKRRKTHLVIEVDEGADFSDYKRQRIIGRGLPTRHVVRVFTTITSQVKGTFQKRTEPEKFSNVSLAKFVLAHLISGETQSSRREESALELRIQPFEVDSSLNLAYRCDLGYQPNERLNDAWAEYSLNMVRSNSCVSVLVPR